MSIFDLFKKKPTEEPEVIKASNVNNRTDETSFVKRNVEDSEQQESPSETLLGVTANGKRRVHNLIILDESGSMMSIYKPALTGVNETLQTIRSAQNENPEQVHFVSLIAFDSNHYNVIYNHVSAKDAKDITKKQYRPEGGTPLYDAMGRSITDLRKHVSDGDAVLVTIITDGYENASREYTGVAIKALVEQMKANDWIFTYIGANQDVEAVAASMSINNSLAFGADDVGTEEMFAKEMRCRRRHYSLLNRPDSSKHKNMGYFDE